nr:MAG TPA: major capsid protein [Caudoviricetes sp.]
MSDIQDLKELGISSPYAVKVMPYHRDGNRIITDYNKISTEQIAQDAALSTTPNIGVPSAYVTYLDPQITDILFAVMNATKLFGETRKGDWTTQFMNFPVSEVVGDVTPYSDFTYNVSSDVNTEFPTRQNFVFETTIKYGDLEEATAAKARLNYAGMKQQAAAQIIARAHNRFYLYGVANKNSYGALNDPNLPDSETPVSVNSKTTWADKVADQGNNAVISNVIFNDVAKLINALMSQNGGNLDNSSDYVLAVAPDRWSYLTIPNSFGQTALSLLKDNYPNMTLIQLPELQTSSGSMLYLTVPTYMGQPTAECAYSEKMRMCRVEPKSTSYLQKAVGGTYGCVIRRPNFVATMTGV